MAIYVHKCQYAGPRYSKVRVSYVAQRDHDFLFWPYPETVKINKEDFHKWTRVV